MQILDLTLSTPAENLACDEALLEHAEEAGGAEVLRFWESPDLFVVLGYSNKAESEVHLESCQKDTIPVLRRPSGGGTVLQGKGCLNFSLILKIPAQGPLANLQGTHHYVLEMNQKALSPLASGLEVQGISDLTLQNLKFSGNAQRRKKDFLLFHGTFLYAFDFEPIEKYLKFPSRQPDYRNHRPHRNFLTNIPLQPHQMKESLKKEWKATEPLKELPQEMISRLVREKYSNAEWNFKF